MPSGNESGLSSPLSSVLSSSLLDVPSSPLSALSRSPSPPPSFLNSLFTPPPSQDAGEDMPRPRKRRKIERLDRTTRYLDLTSETAQSDYDRRDSIDVLLHALRKRRKIVVIAGAGISVTAGIPDFRSANGLFAGLQKEHKLKGGSGKQLFDASVYKDASSTSQFHDMVRKLDHMCKCARPTTFHHMVARLATEGRLLRLYTQNVDGLETQLLPLETTVPLPHKGPWPQTVQLHGGLDKMMCQKCRAILDFESNLFEGSETPTCPECRATDEIRTNDLGRRSHGIGRLRPRIVLYNEQNPDEEAIGAVSAADMRTRPDAVVVVGTSMKIPGVRRIVSEMCKIVRDRREGTTIWINPDPEPTGLQFDSCWDLIVKGTSDDVADLVKLRQWDDPNMEDPDAPTEYTDSDVERVNARQGEIRINLPPSPFRKTSRPDLIPVMTPPRSQHGDSLPDHKVQLSTQSQPKSSTPSPLRIKLKVGEKSAKAEEDIKKQQEVQINVPVLQKGPLSTVEVSRPQKTKNPASGGKKLTDVLGKENVAKNRKSKTSLKKDKTGKTGNKSGKLQQTRMAAKITKSAASLGSIQVVVPAKRPSASLFKDDLRDDELTSDYRRWAQQSALSSGSILMSTKGSQLKQHLPTPTMTSSRTTPHLSPEPQTPAADSSDLDVETCEEGAPMYDRHATESPKGGLPRGMENLLHI
ncbi:hypothetical protein LTR05_001190 [Lithohypha guttulata]|uniref:Deacetylase sirtuin-type domain-containing protein n=1 Tax=Lithohypha guttulata TaxID=1690604 RepID=A0AAN7T7L9_9EURO|nr:hypothetical protein LTR05_001190 [Lithohypha guttulata]